MRPPPGASPSRPRWAASTPPSCCPTPTSDRPPPTSPPPSPATPARSCLLCRVVAVGAALDPLREALAEALRALPVGDPADPATVCGPLVSAAARDRFDRATRGGLSVAATGTAPDGPGWYAAPVLAEKVPQGHPLLHEEVFGPVAALLPADDLAHAVRITNSVPYGLVTSVHTAGLDAVLHGLDRLDTGMVRVNAPSTGVDFHLPFGGTKASSHGPREQGRAALEFYTSSRTYTLAPINAM